MSVRTIAAVSTTAVALVAAPVLSAQASTHTVAAHRAPATTAHVRTVTYPGVGASVSSTRDAVKLRATSTRFADFAVREMRRQRTEVQPGCRVVLYVQSYRTDGFAVGNLWARGCGGTKAVWATKHGVWGEIWEGQYQPTCKELSHAAGRTVPKGLASCR